MKNRPRIVVIAEGAIPTGFARVATSLFSRLYRSCDIRQFTPHALPADRPADDPPWPIQPLPSADDPDGEQRMLAAIEAAEPDLVWILADLQILREYVRVLSALRRRRAVRIIGYCPIDLTPLPTDLLRPLLDIDAIVAYTQYGRDALANAFSADSQSTQRKPPLRVIPHGLDTATFSPMDRHAARSTLLGDGHANDFIVLNANRNQPRKRIDTSVQAFAAFAAGKPDSVRLHLHMGMRDRGWDIPALISRYGLQERIIYTTDQPGMPFIADALLNVVYNVADVGINTATTEGWGLVSLEHAATGAAQIVPGHSVFSEIWTGSALLVSPRLHLVTPAGHFDEHYVASDDVAAALERLYVDPSLRQSMATAAYANATQPCYSWDQIARQWGELFNEMLN
ncbi:MAG: glycosyltransferase [Tahibacter sp.]